MADVEKATPKTAKAKAAATDKKRKAKTIEPTAASHRPSRSARKPNRFEFGAEDKAPSKRKRAASKERASPSKKRKTTKKATAKKAKKDPNAPKKAATSYILFANAHRDKIKKEHPDATFGEVGKLLGKQWAKATKAEKAKYEAKADKDKERYRKELAKYSKSSGKSESEEESSE